jgi:hypothetical protein
MNPTITVSVKAPSEPIETHEVEVERHPSGWVTTGVRPADQFRPGPVELRLQAGPDGAEFVEGEYEATVDFVDGTQSRDNARVLFVGPK